LNIYGKALANIDACLQLALVFLCCFPLLLFIALAQQLSYIRKCRMATIPVYLLAQAHHDHVIVWLHIWFIEDYIKPTSINALLAPVNVIREHNELLLAFTCKLLHDTIDLLFWQQVLATLILCIICTTNVDCYSLWQVTSLRHALLHKWLDIEQCLE